MRIMGTGKGVRPAAGSRPASRAPAEGVPSAGRLELSCAGGMSCLPVRNRLFSSQPGATGPPEGSGGPMVNHIEKMCRPLAKDQRQQLAVSIDDFIFDLLEDVSAVFKPA
ncbi:hypothetical protein PAMA_015565 [Pampus argenteus]